MRILVIDDAYPSPTKLYADVFAHVRVKAYRECGHEILVAASFSERGLDYEFEGIPVVRAGSTKALLRIAESFEPEVILVHFATFSVIRDLILKKDVPYIIWSHGFDAVGWYRRLYEYRDAIHFMRYIKGNMVQRYYYRKLIARANKNGRIHLVFVSGWLKKVAQVDALIHVKNSSIIPNPIDNHLFIPGQKHPEDRKRLLILRPAHKSGSDIIIKSLMILRSEPWFFDLSIGWFGEGASKGDFAKEFGQLPNVTISEGTRPQSELPSIYARYGVSLCASRQDSHGVSMCEAMSSGLAVVSCRNSAIPEYVDHQSSGLLTTADARSFADAIARLYHDPELFISLSRRASSAIIEKAGIDKVIAAEMTLIERMAGQCS